MDLLCRHTTIGEVPTLQVVGELDLASIPAMRNAVLRLIADAPGVTVAIDLDGLSSLDDAGLGVLLGAAGRARDAGGDLVLVCTSPRLRDRLERCRLHLAIDVRDRVAG
jgi:anti-sigma B factor antagonist